MRLLYMAAPVAGDVPGNTARALRWLAYLTSISVDHVIAPWIAGLLAGEDDSDPEQRERGLQTCAETARRCDGIILIGGRISSGMRREMDAVRESGGRVIDLTHLGVEPPTMLHERTERGLAELRDAEPIVPLPRHWLAEEEVRRG